MRPPGPPGNGHGQGGPPQGGPPGNGGEGGGEYNMPPPLHPPFLPDIDPDVDPRDQQLAAMIAGVIRSGVRQDDKPNYRGIKRPEIDSFNGDVSKYQHWKSTFNLMYTPNRNLPDDHLATTLLGLMKGKAKELVLIHVTAKWDGSNYKEMWEQLD